MSSRTLVCVFLPFAFGYFLSYLYRIVNAVIAPELLAELNLSPADLGLVSSAYFLTFAALQLPLGVLLDRYEPRSVNALLLLVALLGAWVFSTADSLWGLILGRGLIGLGVSACLMAAFKAYVLWFPPQRLPLINGLQLTAGGLGALAATTPVELALTLTGWRGLFQTLAAVTLLASVLLITLVPSRRPEPSGEGVGRQLKDALQVFVTPAFYRVAPASFLAQASFAAIQGLWAGPWLSQAVGLERSQVADTLFLSASGMVAGFLLLGLLAERLQRRGISPQALSLSGIAVFLLVQGALFLQPESSSPALWLLFGLFGTSGTLMYAGLIQSFPQRLSGRVSTCLNLLIFVGAFALQWGIGAVIGLWVPSAGGVYPAAAFQSGFLLCALLQVLALGWYFLAPIVAPVSDRPWVLEGRPD